MAQRTQAEVDRQIEGLENMIKKGADRYDQKTLDGIHAQIAILKDETIPYDYYFEEDDDDFDGDNYVYYEAVKADNWLDGKHNVDLFEVESDSVLDAGLPRRRFS